MANASLGTVLRHVQVLAAAQAGEDLSDAELLESFLSRQDQRAFAALVLRHGPMVLNTCRRLLGQQHDAEDALQATFLILARKAASVRRRPELAGWLYWTAYRMALSIKRAAVRRRTHERRARAKAPSDPCAEVAWREVQVLLEEEIHRLPEKYRMVFVLCCLESKPRAEVARLLGVKEGTVSSRLDQTRKLLQTRLARRGVTLSGVLAATALTQPAGSAAVVPAAVFATTVQAAAALSVGQGGAAGVVSARVVALVEGGLKTMVTAKQIATVLVLVLALVAGGAGLILCQSPAAPAPDERQVEQPEPLIPRADPPKAAQAKQARTDRHGDPLPAGALARLGTMRWRHGDQVMAIAYAPDGKTLATGSMDEAIHLWDAKTGQRLRIYRGHSGWVQSVFFTPDGKELISWGHDKTARVWDIAAGKELRRWSTQGGWKSALSPDGKPLATLGQTSPMGSIDLWDVAIGTKVREVACEGELDGIDTLAFSHDGKQLAAGGSRLRLFDVAAGKQLHAFGAGTRITSLAFLADGKTLAVERCHEPATIWDSATFKPLRRMAGALGGARVIALSPDDKILAAFDCSPGMAGLCDVATGKKVRDLPGPFFQVWSAAFSPDGKTLAVANLDSRVRLVDVATGKELPPTEGHREWISFLAFVDGDRRLATASSDGLARIWDLASGQMAKEFPEAGTQCYCGDVSPDGRTLALGGGKGLHLFDWATGKTLHQLKGHQRPLFAVAFSPKGDMLATGANTDQFSNLWDPATGKELRRIPSPNQLYLSCLAWSPNGKVLASGAAAGGMRGKLGHNICLWDSATGKQLGEWNGPPWREGQSKLGSGEVSTLAFSPDGTLLASGDADQTVSLWEVPTGKLRMRLHGHQGAVRAVAFSPDGRMVASGGQDRSVRLWEVSTGKERRSFEGHLGWITRLAFSADGQTLASASGDTSALVWPVWGSPGQPEAVKLSKERLQSLWNELASEDAPAAYRAMTALRAIPKQTVPWMRDQLPALTTAAAPPVAPLIADLDAEGFAVREKAEQELEALGEAAEPALRRALAGRPSAEVRRRIERLLERLTTTPPRGKQLQALRAIEVLEHSGTAEARVVLKVLAKGAPDARLTREAKAALERFAKGQGSH